MFLLCCAALLSLSLQRTYGQQLIAPVTANTCSSINVSATQEAARKAIQDYFTVPPRTCGGSEWTRAVYLNMSDLSQTCPSNWTLVTSPVRGCGRTSDGCCVCNPVSYSVGRSYSEVCGRILAIHTGSLALGFQTFNENFYNTLDSAYLDGVVLVHSSPSGSLQHIWSFVKANKELDHSGGSTGNCPCNSVQIPWLHRIPSFVNTSYFCDTGNPGTGSSDFSDDPLWDGQGCGASSTCCEFNNPPWFFASLPQTTSDNLEVRKCYAAQSAFGDAVITLMEIYVK